MRKSLRPTPAQLVRRTTFFFFFFFPCTSVALRCPSAGALMVLAGEHEA
jgi:hypothetical protein